MAREVGGQTAQKVSQGRRKPRTIGKLTALDVNRAKRRGYYNDGGGLYLLVGPTGSKSWVFRFRDGARLREHGLGPLHTIGLAEAREKARTCRHMRLDGTDPIEARKAARGAAKLEAAKAMTFKQCAEAYINAHNAGWRNPKHAAQWPATLEAYVYPVFGSLPVQAVDVGLVMKALEPIWTVKPETASRVRGRIESALDWATARGYRQGENPARWRGHLENLLPKKTKVRQVEHHAALPYAELADFLVELRQQEGIAARALQFTILTAARTGEVLGAKWSEIDFKARLWTVPGSRMKSGREHRVPLSDGAVAVLEGMKAIREGDFVFPGGRARRPLSNMAFLMLLRRMGRGDLTAHGFRSTFSDWCSERTNFPAEVREMALAHTVSDKVEAAYRRGDLFQKRRQVMDAWARYCVAPAGAGEVVTLAAAR
jgi:integrase